MDSSIHGFCCIEPKSIVYSIVALELYSLNLDLRESVFYYWWMSDTVPYVVGIRLLNAQYTPMGSPTSPDMILQTDKPIYKMQNDRLHPFPMPILNQTAFPTLWQTTEALYLAS